MTKRCAACFRRHAQAHEQGAAASPAQMVKQTPDGRVHTITAARNEAGADTWTLESRYKGHLYERTLFECERVMRAFVKKYYQWELR